MAQAIETGTGICRLRGVEIDLDISTWLVPPKWRDALAHRDQWAALSAAFRSCRSIEEAAQSVAITSDLAVRLLDFLCMEICGCRAVTCVSCLDDYRSQL